MTKSVVGFLLLALTACTDGGTAPTLNVVSVGEKAAVQQALTLSFDTVVPGHGLVSTRADLTAYRERATRFAATLAELVSQGKTRAEIETVVRGQFAWEDFHVQAALDGLINEFR